MRWRDWERKRPVSTARLAAREKSKKRGENDIIYHYIIFTSSCGEYEVSAFSSIVRSAYIQDASNE